MIDWTPIYYSIGIIVGVLVVVAYFVLNPTSAKNLVRQFGAPERPEPGEPEETPLPVTIQQRIRIERADGTFTEHSIVGPWQHYTLYEDGTEDIGAWYDDGGIPREIVYNTSKEEVSNDEDNRAGFIQTFIVHSRANKTTKDIALEQRNKDVKILTAQKRTLEHRLAEAGLPEVRIAGMAKQRRERVAREGDTKGRKFVQSAEQKKAEDSTGIEPGDIIGET